MSHDSIALEKLEQPGTARGVESGSAVDLARPLAPWERLWNLSPLRKLVILALLLLLWQWYALRLDNPLLFPTCSATVAALLESLIHGDLSRRILVSLQVLLAGYGVGVALAALLAIAAVGSRLGNDLLELLTAMFNPLPAIALLPLALLWFGLGNGSLIFVLVHAVLWPMTLNAHSGFSAISGTIRMVGRNYGLTGWRYACQILLPAAFPQVLTGLKISWAFAWRTLIAAELVFGVSSGSGGVGWFIYEQKNQLEIAAVFAGLLTVILIGLAVENLLFRVVEQSTIRKWGMKA